jgi:hypothetical protein
MFTQPNTCQNCKSENPQGSHFCSQCGQELPKPDPNRMVYNIFTAWAKVKNSPYNCTFGTPFENEEELLKVTGEYGANTNIVAYIGGYSASLAGSGDMILTVQTWRRILTDGTLDKDEGPITILLTNLEKA